MDDKIRSLIDDLFSEHISTGNKLETEVAALERELAATKRKVAVLTLLKTIHGPNILPSNVTKEEVSAVHIAASHIKKASRQLRYNLSEDHIYNLDLVPGIELLADLNGTLCHANTIAALSLLENRLITAANMMEQANLELKTHRLNIEAQKIVQAAFDFMVSQAPLEPFYETAGEAEPLAQTFVEGIFDILEIAESPRAQIQSFKSRQS